jgi:hypothetical protein
MPYTQRVTAMRSLGTTDAQQLNIELNALRAELDDVRTKYTALVALLAAATALGAGYNTGTALAARQFTPT